MNTNKIISFLNSNRHLGSTNALILCLKQHPDAKMLVHSGAFARHLSKFYDIPPHRFITIHDVGHPQTALKGPLLVDLPVLQALIEEAKKEGGKKLRNHKGVTYQDGKWHFGNTYVESAVKACSFYISDATDEDHKALMSLKETPYEDSI
jgi:hypothetical protein